VRVPSHEPPGRQRECAQSRRQPRSAAADRLEPGRTRRPFLQFELEEARLRVDGFDGAYEHDAAAVQEPRADHERGCRAAGRVEHDVLDHADSRAAGAHGEAFGSREPVLEHVAAPAEHVRPHIRSIPQPGRAPNLRALEIVPK